MKHLSKNLCLVITAVMTMSALLSGCGKTSGNKTTTQGTDTSKPVELKMILLGSKPVGCDAVYAKVNEKLKKLVNATITPTFYDWGDWQTKYNLAFASGEDFDLIYTSNWAYYNEQSTKNGFLQLTDAMIKKDAPKTWADIKPDQWTQTKVNGKVFMVPYTYKEFNNNIVMIRGDLRAKYNLPEVKTMDDFINYMDTIAKNEKSILAFNAGGVDGTAMYTRLMFANDNNTAVIMGGKSSPLAYDISSVSKVVTTNLLDDPKYLEELKQLQVAKNKGYWSQNTLSNKTANETAFDSGASATYPRGPLNVAQAYMKDMLAHPDWKLEIADINPNAYVVANPVTNNGIAIHITSKNPDRALMVVDLLRNNKEINDLTTLGIPGTHWEAVGDTQYKALPAGKDFGPDSACPWGWRTSLYRTDAGSPQAVLDVNKKFDAKAKVNPIQLFNFDSSSVKGEIAAVAAVIAVYNPILSGGFAPDIDKTVKEYKAKLDAAGYQKVVTEWKTQADAFVKAYTASAK